MECEQNGDLMDIINSRSPHMRETMTDFLFPQPSALMGAARSLDLWAQIDSYNEVATPAEADALALYSDWRAVGEDLQGAIREYAKR